MESRLSDFIRLLMEHPRGLSVREIAQRLGITRQSVYRLRDKVQALGLWAVTHSEDPQVPRGWMRLEAMEGVDLVVRLTRAEVEALRIALERVEPLTPLARKALARLAPEALEMPKAEPVLYSPTVDLYPEGLFQKVVQAIRDRRVCEVTYRNAKGEVKTYRFDPYVVVVRDRHLYLVGANHNSRAHGYDPVKELRLDQILGFKLTRHRFPRPDFDVEAYAQGRFRAFAGNGPPVRVRVRFSPEKAGFIRRTRRHPTQQVEDLPDGSVIWQVVVPLSEDLLHFVIGYGPHAVVLEPAELREQVVAWAQGILEVYREGRLSPEVVTNVR